MNQKKIAVVGSGIAGLSAAHLLNRRHEVHLFEKRARLGGHTHTVKQESGGQVLPLDTGFIVFNEQTYPNLTRLFAQLGVATQSSDMSFAVSCRKPDLEYCGSSLPSLFAQPSNILRPSFLRMIRDIRRFGPIARARLESTPDPTVTLGKFVEEEGFSSSFADFFLLPMAAAIWSTGTGPAADFPRDTLLRFFHNHGLLTIKGQPEWRTVVGGSSSYIPALTRDFADRVHLGSGVRRIVRRPQEVVLLFQDGEAETFDHVVIAAHADQALEMLDEPRSQERDLLGAWTYSVNDTWLHTDQDLLPRRRAARASWNYLIDDVSQSSPQVSVSYLLNRLQRIGGDTSYVVTLNPPQEPRPDHVLRRMSYRHPVYSPASVATQADLPGLNGVRRTHFCGAYHRYGFHEDGLVSALGVAQDFGISL